MVLWIQPCVTASQFHSLCFRSLYGLVRNQDTIGRCSKIVSIWILLSLVMDCASFGMWWEQLRCLVSRMFVADLACFWSGRCGECGSALFRGRFCANYWWSQCALLIDRGVPCLARCRVAEIVLSLATGRVFRLFLGFWMWILEYGSHPDLYVVVCLATCTFVSNCVRRWNISGHL